MRPCAHRLLAVIAGALAAGSALADWPQWRGPLGTGEAPGADPPVTWSESTNLRWKFPLAGKGHATPVVWNGRIFVTLAAPVGDAREPAYAGAEGAHDNRPVTHVHQYRVIAIDCATGQAVWDRTLREALPHEGGHFTGSLASASPVTDGKRLYVSFGSQGLFALDFDGAVEWETGLGAMHTRHAHGEGSSPALAGDSLIVNWDHEGDSFVAALDARTGRERWRTPRDEITSWSSPIAVETGGRNQVVIAATGKVRAYDAATGDPVWKCGGLSRNVVATPVAGDGLVFVANNYDWQAMMAIRLEGATGDITGTDRVAWTRNRLTPYVPSPLLYRGVLYFHFHNQGILTGVDAGTGAVVFETMRTGGAANVFASPLAAAGRIYIADRNGAVAVIALGDPPRILATNRLDDRFSASPAAVGDALYLRGEQNLYCIAETEAKPAEP